jgi:hypothetical protein
MLDDSSGLSFRDTVDEILGHFDLMEEGSNASHYNARHELLRQSLLAHSFLT